MQIVKTISETRKIISDKRAKQKTIGLVPTMGALHEGHLSLIKKSASECDFTAVSVFVNPIQFGPNEDLSKYPRPIERDCELAAAAGADLVFHPEVEEILGSNMLTFVDIKELSDNLCGASREGHFRGVCTIVTKLFHILTPDRAYFGQKDIQQLMIIKKMVQDLNFDLTIVPCPIVRENDGLAMSSRNVYLTPRERQDALILSRAIKKGAELFKNDEKSAEKIMEILKNMINKVAAAKIDYVKIVDENIKDVTIINRGHILALAVFIGSTRLIDNHIMGDEICY